MKQESSTLKHIKQNEIVSLNGNENGFGNTVNRQSPNGQMIPSSIALLIEV